MLLAMSCKTSQSTTVSFGNRVDPPYLERSILSYVPCAMSKTIRRYAFAMASKISNKEAVRSAVGRPAEMVSDTGVIRVSSRLNSATRKGRTIFSNQGRNFQTSGRLLQASVRLVNSLYFSRNFGFWPSSNFSN